MTAPTRPATVARLDEIIVADPSGDGVHWALEESRDLNANLVHLDASSEVAAHTNRDVDVVIVVIDGEGRLVVEGVTHDLAPHTFVLVAQGTERAVTAGPEGLTYLTVHRRRGPMDIGGARPH